MRGGRRRRECSYWCGGFKDNLEETGIVEGSKTDRCGTWGLFGPGIATLPIETVVNKLHLNGLKPSFLPLYLVLLDGRRIPHYRDLQATSLSNSTVLSSSWHILPSIVTEAPLQSCPFVSTCPLVNGWLSRSNEVCLHSLLVILIISLYTVLLCRDCRTRHSKRCWLRLRRP